MNQTKNSAIILSKTVKQKRIIENRIIRAIVSYERCQESQNRVIENEFPLSKSIVKLLNKVFKGTLTQIWKSANIFVFI